jgi:hypothetical protein
MTLNDISRLLKFAAVPRSKTIQKGYPNPAIIVHVPATHLGVVREVMQQMCIVTDNISATLLESSDVRDGEHVYIKWTGDNEVRHYQDHVNGITLPPGVQYRVRRKEQISRNRSVVLDIASAYAK